MVRSRRFRSDEAVNILRNDIVLGKYRVGIFLPSERKLTEILEVSRGTVRCILKQLQEESLIRINPGRGAYVAETVERKGLKRFIVFMSGIAPLGRANEGVGVLLGICRGASKLHAEAVISFTRDEEIVQEAISRYAAGEIQGLIYSDCSDYDKFIAPLEKNGIPYAVTNLEFDIPALAARMDLRSVGRAAGRHLASLGHKNIGILSGPTDKFIYREILAGFRGALAEDEIQLEHIAEVNSESEPSRIAALEMLSLPNRPSAIFASRDIRAAGCYAACRELGLKIPEDLSIAAYDDITWPEGRNAGLDTVREPIEEMGEASVELLQEWIISGKKPESRIFKGEMTVRNSSKKLEN